MTRGKGTMRTLTQGEIAALKEEKQEMQATIDHVKSNPGSAHGSEINLSGLAKGISHIDQQIESGSPKEARGRAKDEVLKRAAQIEEEIKQGMPTREEMDHPGKNPGAVRKHMMWLQRNDAKIREYKELQARIDPSDPTLRSIERFRK